MHDLRCKLERNHADNPRSLHRAKDIVWHGALDDVIDRHEARRKQGNSPTFMAVDEVRQHLGGPDPVLALQAQAGRSTSGAHELAEWWRETAENEIEQTVAKAVEYGATDLIDIGRTLARVAGREIPDSEAAEWGIFFYLEGKLSRWRSAIERGDLPSFDTLLDIGVYARMAQRVRMTGGWPGTEDK